MDERGAPEAGRLRSALDAPVRGGRTPGIQYLVVDGARTVLEYDGGWADIATRRPMGPATTMMAYSMSKPITAAAALQLVEAEKVGLDDPIDRFLDSNPYGREITVRQLLSHTSGIPNPIPLKWVHPAALHEAFDEAAALATVLRENRRLSFAPGTRYTYSNIGYWLLGRIVERASGEAFVSYATEHVLRPLGITEEELGYAVARPADHATGYLERLSFTNLVKGWIVDRELIGSREGRWLEIKGHYPNGPAFGGLVGTARGFGKLLQDQLRPRSRLFDDATRDLFHAEQATRRGNPVGMTLGWHIGSTRGVRFLYKEGGGGGFHGMMRLYPSAGIATVVMTNATRFDVRGHLDSIDPCFLGIGTEAPSPSGPDG